jgi:hypothetical protein
MTGVMIKKVDANSKSVLTRTRRILADKVGKIEVFRWFVVRGWWPVGCVKNGGRGPLTMDHGQSSFKPIVQIFKFAYQNPVGLLN